MNGICEVRDRIAIDGRSIKLVPFDPKSDKILRPGERVAFQFCPSDKTAQTRQGIFIVTRVLRRANETPLAFQLADRREEPPPSGFHIVGYNTTQIANELFALIAPDKETE